MHFAVGEAGLAIIENTLLANRHREPVYRPLQFQKRSQHFIGVPGNRTQYPTRRAVIRIYDDAGNVIRTHEHAGDFKE